MRTRRTLLLLGLALACGGLAAYATMEFLERQTQAPLLATPAPPSTSQVVVAARDIPFGTVLSEADVKTLDWPGDAVPQGIAREVPGVVGRAIITPVLLNEPILDRNLADRGAVGLPVKIPEGMRAVSMRVDDVSGVGGWILPGHRVDFMLTFGSPSDSRTQVFLQNIEIAASGQVDIVDENGKVVVTPVLHFLVSPEDAEKVAHAQTMGRIQLALRGPADVKEVRTQGATLAGIIGRRGPSRPAGSPSPSPAVSTPPPPSVLEVINGPNRTRITIPNRSGGGDPGGSIGGGGNH